MRVVSRTSLSAPRGVDSIEGEGNRPSMAMRCGEQRGCEGIQLAALCRSITRCNLQVFLMAVPYCQRPKSLGLRCHLHAIYRPSVQSRMLYTVRHAGCVAPSDSEASETRRVTHGTRGSSVGDIKVFVTPVRHFQLPTSLWLYVEILHAPQNPLQLLPLPLNPTGFQRSKSLLLKFISKSTR